MDKQVGVAFIGAGDISYLHGIAIKNIAAAKFCGLWNITQELANEKHALFGGKIYPSAAALCQDPEVDVVYILTSLEAHHRYATMALEAGKHVFVEKPVGSNVPEIESLRETANRAGKLCIPGHNYIYDDSIIRARDIIERGDIGDIVSIYIMYNIQHPEDVAARCEGVIRQILTHHSYILIYLGGQPKEVSAMKSVIHYEELKKEDLAMCNIKMHNESIAHFCASFAADDQAGDPWTMMVKVIGTHGATRYSYRDWVDNRKAQVHSQTYLAYPYSIEQIDRYFIERCVIKNEPPLSTLDDAITAQKMIEAMEASIDKSKIIPIR